MSNFSNQDHPPKEYHTANKRIRVECLCDGKWQWFNFQQKKPKNLDLQSMIQLLANAGYNFAGKINEERTSWGSYYQYFLFIRKEKKPQNWHGLKFYDPEFGFS